MAVKKIKKKVVKKVKKISTGKGVTINNKNVNKLAGELLRRVLTK
jgi:hypothetical protein